MIQRTASRSGLFLLLLQISLLAFAQEPLPAFEVRDIGSGRMVISWYNNYPYTAQITIQRSFDSLRGYKSILTVPDPTAIQNGYADTKAVNDHMFYRLYVLLDKGQYFFTTPRQPLKQQASAPLDLPSGSPKNTTIATNSTYPAPALSQQKDSLAQHTPSPQFTVRTVEPVVIKLDRSKMGDSAKVPFTVSPQNNPDAYAPSLYVYAQPDGNIRIDVPNKKRFSNYRIRFYEADKQFLFELKQLPAASFQLDKTNFLHSGWFLFELYEEARLVERHKVFLEKDF